eukprot:1143150-Amphidinium_carterae.1
MPVYPSDLGANAWMLFSLDPHMMMGHIMFDVLLSCWCFRPAFEVMRSDEVTMPSDSHLTVEPLVHPKAT